MDRPLHSIPSFKQRRHFSGLEAGIRRVTCEKQKFLNYINSAIYILLQQGTNVTTINLFLITNCENFPQYNSIRPPVERKNGEQTVLVLLSFCFHVNSDIRVVLCIATVVLSPDYTRYSVHRMDRL